MHEETALDAMAEASVKKAKKKVAKKRQKGKLAAKMSKISDGVKKTEEKEKKEKLSKEELAVKKRVEELREQKIKNVEDYIKEAAEKGVSHYCISALWSDAVEMSLLHIVREWAREQGFELHESYNDIYEPPHGSDDLPSDTRAFLTISWE
jgi:predicted transcriptional regulator